MYRWAWVLLIAAGCQSIDVRPASQLTAQITNVADSGTDQTEEQPSAIRSVSASVTESQFQLEDKADFHRQTASTLIKQGHDAEATVHMANYVALRPAHLVARVQLGELLHRQELLNEARNQYEQFVALAQPHSDLAAPYLIHCHTRLVDIAEKQENEYAAHLNRGIGLYLLANYEDGNDDDEPDAEAVLWRAGKALRSASETDNNQPRPQLYQYKVWTQLGRTSAARRALILADQHDIDGSLTAQERQDLQMAVLRQWALTPPAR